ncbi:PREDICTED: astacin-like metalloendopeptidase [Rhinopithecus bieti]|uniref:astacin-like metalloendopeptidase n=1 Tax=Rhinopithecus bieti TaxID=61621 RepID=UPI00083C2378|nr:PREDICTED: astacin-like metalloendopeptidase [Rhinopithecus bieti]
MEDVGGLRPWVLGLLFLPGMILGAPLASSCPGACGTSFPDGLTPEGTQASWDKDIPAINQGLIPEETPESSFLIEGDIVRPSPFRLLSATSNKWPTGGGGVVEVPFLLSSKYDEPSRQVILEALADFERSTCVRFVAYQGQRDFISIIPMYGCFSSVGRSGGMQVVSLAPTCLQKGRGIVLHELMHVLGFWHEHARADRDRYIRINWNEILPGLRDLSEEERGSKSGEVLWQEAVGYAETSPVQDEYARRQDGWRELLRASPWSGLGSPSVMHYGRLAFSRRGLPTITPLWAPSVHIGQRWNLSASDITRVLKLYGCSPSGPRPRGRGSQAHSSGRSPALASPSLQQLLEALSAESRSPDPSASSAGGQPVPVGPGESPRGWESPVLKKLSAEASARQPQTLASSPRSRPGAGAPGIAQEQSWLAEASTEPTAPSSEAGIQPVSVQGSPALPGGCVPGNHF